ncbi:hypothetical protein [Schaedlerella arabinosiphila]|uniref:hypothetical protein n=1 Tax=Schaedlerella arabinosiphila TaxID=2044587 RepID=UPI00255833C2|nr:hypothetical protein [Schaedlerella arabinosiphila]
MENTLRDELKYIFENVNHWLGVAEAKNAGLLAFNIAIIAALLSNDIFSEYFTLKVIILIFFLISTTISLIALIPLTAKIKLKKPQANINDNPLFFQDIIKYDYTDYLDYVKNRYYTANVSCGKYEMDLAQEIVENSKNACVKYFLFKKAVFVNLMTVVIFAVVLVIA